MSLPAVVNLSIQQGATFDQSFIWSSTAPLDLTGYTADMQLRGTQASSILLEITTSTTGSKIFLNESTGQIRVHIRATDTANLAASGVYDLKLTAPDTTVTTLIGGTYVLNLAVTR